MRTLIMVVLMAGLLQSCGDSKAQSPGTVIEVYGAPAGIRCFALQEEGRSAGLSCVRD